MARPSGGGLSASALDSDPWLVGGLSDGSPAADRAAPPSAVPLLTDPALESPAPEAAEFPTPPQAAALAASVRNSTTATSESSAAANPAGSAASVPGRVEAGAVRPSSEGVSRAPGRQEGGRRSAALVDGAQPAARGGTSVISRWLGRVVRSTAAVLLLAVLWEVLPRLGVVDRVFLPPLSEVVTAWFDLAVSGQLADHTRASLLRSLAGFGLAIAAAIPLGLLIGWYQPLADFLNPVLELFRNTAALALLPVFVLVLGLGETSKISIILYACSWPILLNTIAGVRNVDPLLIKSARSMGLNAARLFQKVILPAAVPTVFTGIRLAGAYSILVLIAAEMVGAKAGLGYLINDAQFNFRVPDMYAAIITISVLGLLFNLLLLRLERRFSTWRLS